MSKGKHIPQRTCVACRTSSAKREFVRAVRTPDGAVDVDPTGRRAGRGAYICASASCWDEALKHDKLARALRTSITSEQREALRSYGERFERDAAGVGA